MVVGCIHAVAASFEHEHIVAYLAFSDAGTSGSRTLREGSPWV
jgi:hypothetical protein